jgi:hypothetical protein
LMSQVGQKRVSALGCFPAAWIEVTSHHGESRLENILAALRRIISGPLVPAAVIFVALACALPPWLAVLSTKHFAGNDGARMDVAVLLGEDSFYLYPTGVPSTLEQVPFLADAAMPGTPDNPEPPELARVVHRGAPGVLMETVRRLDYVTVTSRYLVMGRQLVPVSQMSFGVLDKLLGGLTAAAVAFSSWALLAWRRRVRAGRAA